MHSLDDVSVGSPAGTVVTVASCQASYNTNALVLNANEVHFISNSDARAGKEVQSPANGHGPHETLSRFKDQDKDGKNLLNNQKVRSRVSIPSPSIALENLESSDFFEKKPAKQIKNLNIIEDHHQEGEDKVQNLQKFDLKFGQGAGNFNTQISVQKPARMLGINPTSSSANAAVQKLKL